MAARAEASERLSGEIISSLTAGAIVAGLDGEIKTLNPAGRRILELPERRAVPTFAARAAAARRHRRMPEDAAGRSCAGA